MKYVKLIAGANQKYNGGKSINSFSNNSQLSTSSGEAQVSKLISKTKLINKVEF